MPDPAATLYCMFTTDAAVYHPMAPFMEPFTDARTYSSGRANLFAFFQGVCQTVNFLYLHYFWHQTLAYASRTMHESQRGDYF